MRKKPDLYFIVLGAKFIFVIDIFFSILFGYVLTGLSEDFFVFHYFDELFPRIPLYAKHAYSETAFKMVHYSTVVNLILSTLVCLCIDLPNASKVYDAISNKKAVLQSLASIIFFALVLLLIFHSLYLLELDVNLDSSYRRGRAISRLLISSPLGQGVILGMFHCLMYFIFCFSVVCFVGILRFWFFKLLRQ